MDDFCGTLSIQNWNMNQFVDRLIEFLEEMRQEYIRLEGNEERQYLVWKELIRWLPESWLQTRTVTMNYENLLAMCSKSQRRSHKLNEWSGKRNPFLENFIQWARSLPYAQEFIFLDELMTPGELCAKHLREISSKLLENEPTFNHYGVKLAYDDGRIKPINVLFTELADVFDKNGIF